MHNKITKFIKLIRIEVWGLNIILPFILALISLIIQNKSNLFLSWNFLIYTVMVSIYMLFGFLLNAYGDRKEDYKAQKEVFLFYFKKKTIISILLILAIIYFTIAFLWYGYLGSILFSIWFILSYIYSMPPLKTKNRGIWGLVNSIILLYPFAYFIFSLTFSIPLIISFPFLIFLLLFSTSNDILHQIEDFYNDKQAKVPTFALGIGLKNIIILEKISFIALILSTILPLLYFGLVPGMSILIILNVLCFDLYYEIITVFEDIQKGH